MPVLKGLMLLRESPLNETTLKLVSWNVNGLRALHRKGFLPWLAKEEPDVLCLQETRSSPGQLPPQLRKPGGYHSYFSGARRKGYSGVALYSKMAPHKLWRGFPPLDEDSEGRSLIAHFGDFVVCNVYFPNGKASAERLRYKLNFYGAFLEYLDHLRREVKRILVCGDFNTAHREIDLARPQANKNTSGFLPVERAWVDKLIEHGFVDTFRAFDQRPGQYTWWDQKTRARGRNVGWRIDYIFATSELMDQVVGARILSDVQGSDHCPVAITLSLRRQSDS